jgi:hypothetical protein
MFDVRISVETGNLMKGMERFARETGRALKEVYQEQMVLASNSLVRNFPPKSMAIGRKAILEADLPNIFTEAPSDFLLNSWVTIGETPERIFRTKTGAVIGIDKASYNPSNDQYAMADHHQANRNKSNGRVTRAGAYTRDIGRWKFINRQVMPPGAIKRYANSVVFPKLGTMKAGWVLPAKSGLKTKMPAWVAKTRGRVPNASDYTDQMNLFAIGFLRLENLVPYAARQAGLVRIELQKRQRDLLRKSGRQLELEVAKFNGRAR